MPKLKTCPFCGGPALVKLNPCTLYCTVTCENCGVIMKRDFKGHPAVLDLLAELMSGEWNRRCVHNAAD